MQYFYLTARVDEVSRTRAFDQFGIPAENVEDSRQGRWANVNTGDWSGTAHYTPAVAYGLNHEIIGPFRVGCKDTTGTILERIKHMEAKE